MNINVNKINSVVKKWLTSNSASYNVLGSGQVAKWVTEHKEIYPEEFELSIKVDTSISEKEVTNYFLDQLKKLVTKETFVTLRPMSCLTKENFNYIYTYISVHNYAE